MTIENDSPELTARIDVLLFAVASQLRLQSPHGYEDVFKANCQQWRDTLIASQVSDEYLRAFDERLESFLAMLRG